MPNYEWKTFFYYWTGSWRQKRVSCNYFCVIGVKLAVTLWCQHASPLLHVETLTFSQLHLPVGERLPARIRRRIAGSHKLYPLQPDPGLVGRAVESSMLHNLSQEWDDTLSAILVIIREIDLVTEEHHPLAKLDRWHHHAVGSSSVLTIVVKSLQ